MNDAPTDDSGFDDLPRELADHRTAWTKWTDGGLAFADPPSGDQVTALRFLADAPVVEVGGGPTELAVDPEEFVGVSSDKDWGEDVKGPETEQRVWEWLVEESDESWPVEERIEYAKTIGRYDIVDALEGT